jgi:hypothetical protein
MVRLILLMLVLLAPLAGARADATVTLCAADDQLGTGTNLATAMTIGGRITFACGGAATILLNCSHEIVADTVIDGAGTVTLQANGIFRICITPPTSADVALFHDAPGRSFAFTLANLRLIGVKAPPGSVLAGVKGQLVTGTLALTLSSATISGFTSPIAVSPGQVTIAGGTISDNDGVVVGAQNLAIGGHAAIAGNQGVPLQSLGGTVTIADSAITANKSGSRLVDCTQIEMRDSRFDGNSDPETGGALTIGCDARIATSSFTNNHARTGGALYIGDTAGHTVLTGVTFENNGASADGGAIALRFEIFPPIPTAQMIEIHGGIFKGNQAQIAGALEFARGALPGVALNARTLSVGGTQFIGNQATLAGGGMLLARGQATFSRVLFQANRAGATGGAAAVLESGDGQLVLANSLLVKNVAPVGAALGGQAALLINTTLADNDGPAISAAQTVTSLPVLGGPVGAQPIQLHNTIVAGGTGGPCGPADAAAPYIDLGHNLQSGGNGCGALIPVAAPQFGPSYIPLPTSPAAHGGDDAACAANPVAGRDIWDQIRPYSGHCAIGAAESNVQQIVSQSARPIVGLIGVILRCACLWH